MSDSTEPSAGEGVACIDCQPDPSHPSASSTSAVAAASTTTADAPSEDLLDPTTFVPPLSATDGLPVPLVVIEYCQRCKFGLRANWIQQELLSTFAPSPTPNAASLASVMLIPKIDEASAGRFRVYILNPPQAAEGEFKLLWDRKVEGGFPEMRVLKQKVRDSVNPDFGLGHSDKK